MFRWGLVAIALSGCAQLFGIDETSKATDAQPPPLSSVQLQHLYVGKTMMTAPEDLSASTTTASYFVPDAASPGGVRKVSSTLLGTDTWTADLGGMTVPVEYTSPDVPNNVIKLFDLPSPHLKVLVGVFEKPGHEPAPANPTLNINVGLNPAQNAERYELFTLGSWINVGLTAPGATAGALTQSLPLTTAMSPIKRLDKITIDDPVLILRFVGNTLVGKLDVTPFNQTGTDPITGTVMPVAQDQMLDVTVNQAQVASRYSTVRPAISAPAMQWILRAAPGLDYVIDNGPLLNAAGVAAADPPRITAMYGNPWASTFPTELIWATGASRTYTVPGTTATVTLQAAMQQRIKPTAGAQLLLPAGLPDRITANSTVLNVDNSVVMAPADTPVDVSFTPDMTNNTLYAVELWELVPGATMTYSLSRVMIGFSTNPHVAIPHDHFKPATNYMFRAISWTGCWTAVASGDFTQMTLPCSFAFVDSGVFTVVTP